MNDVLTFEQLPEAVTMLSKEINEIKKLLTLKQEMQQPATEPRDQLLTIQEAAEFLNLSVATIYSKVSKCEIPVMKRSKRLYFSRTELTEYIKEGRQKTVAEIEAEAYLPINKKRLNNGK
jgi:excisionase family DNA binding protein